MHKKDKNMKEKNYYSNLGLCLYFELYKKYCYVRRLLL